MQCQQRHAGVIALGVNGALAVLTERRKIARERRRKALNHYVWRRGGTGIIHALTAAGLASAKERGPWAIADGSERASQERGRPSGTMSITERRVNHPQLHVAQPPGCGNDPSNEGITIPFPLLKPSLVLDVWHPALRLVG